MNIALGSPKGSRRCRCFRCYVHAVEVDKEEAAREEMEDHRAATRERRLAKLQTQLANRNPAADGPSAVAQMRAAQPRDDESECVLLCDADPDDPSAESRPRPMRCCGHLVCTRCLRAWLWQHNQRWGCGYGEGVNGESGREVVTGSAARGTRIIVPCAEPSVSRRFERLMMRDIFDTYVTSYP